MVRWLCFLVAIFCMSAVGAAAQQALETDVFKTDKGDLAITFLGHGSLFFTYGG